MNDESTQSEPTLPPVDRTEKAAPVETAPSAKPPIHDQKATRPSMLWMLVPILLVGLAIFLSR